VRNCIGFADLLCAYADGELPEFNRQSVEDHLAICDNCSAILKLYRELARTIDDSKLLPPEALCIGVMDKIQEESVPRRATTTKQRVKYRKILTRYAPIAACLVAMLLVWQFWGDMFGARNNYASTGSPEPASDRTAAMTTAADAPAPQAEMADMEESVWDHDGGEITAGGGGGVVEVGEEFELDDALGRTDMTDDESIVLWFHAIDGFDLVSGDIARYIGNAYAVVSIIGDMPVFLLNYDPVESTSWDDWWIQASWDELYEIPSQDLPILLNETSDREDAEIARNPSNVNNNIVLVVYSRAA